jgi:ankyrin repeat protein
MKRSFLIISILCWQLIIALTSFAQEPDAAKNDNDKVQNIERIKQLYQRIGQRGKFANNKSKLTDVKKFVEAGVDWKYPNEHGQSILHVAVQGECDMETLTYLIDKGADVNAKNRTDETPIYTAINFKHWDAVKLFLERGADLKAEHKHTKLTPLAYALAQRNTEMEVIKLLVEKGADVNATDTQGLTPLTSILTKSNNKQVLETAKYLMEHGADINAKTKNGMHVFEWIVARNANIAPEILKFLIEKSNKIDWSKSQERHPIKWVIENYYSNEPLDSLKDYIKFFIANGADINSRDRNSNNSPFLFFLYKHGGKQHDLFMFLVECGADIREVDGSGNSVLHIISFCVNVDIRIVKYLVENGANVNAKNFGSSTPLHSVAMHSSDHNFAVIKYLVEQGADVNAKTSENSRPIHFAANAGHYETIKYLTDQKAELNIKTTHGSTPLHSACNHANVDIIKFLIDHGCDINEKDYIGDAPVHYAAQSNFFNKDAMKFICSDRGANVNDKNNAGTTPLMYALKQNIYFDRIKLLIELGADVKAKDNNNTTPLHYYLFRENNSYPSSAFRNHDDRTVDKNIIKLLVQNGADINAANKQNETPAHIIQKNLITVSKDDDQENLKEIIKEYNIDLKTTFGDSKETLLHYAASYANDAEIIKYLINQGLSVNARDRFGSTPLHNAALRSKSYEVVQTLIASGADVNARDNNNVTPLHDAAEHNPNTAILELLIKSGADINAKDIYNMTPIETISETNKEPKEAILKKAAKK